MLSVQEIGEKLVKAGKLKLRPLCVYGAAEIPKSAVASYIIDRCIAKAVYTAALFEETPSLYVDAVHDQCCPGGMVWMGFNEPHPMLKCSAAKKITPAFKPCDLRQLGGGAGGWICAMRDMPPTMKTIAG